MLIHVYLQYGLISINNYMGFGLSGVETRTHMIGSDATIAWVDVSTGRANAVDYHLTGRFQVSQKVNMGKFLIITPTRKRAG